MVLFLAVSIVVKGSASTSGKCWKHLVFMDFCVFSPFMLFIPQTHSGFQLSSLVLWQTVTLIFRSTGECPQFCKSCGEWIQEVQIWLLDPSQSGFNFIAPASKDCYQPSGLADKAGKGMVFCLFRSVSEVINGVLSQLAIRNWLYGTVTKEHRWEKLILAFGLWGCIYVLHSCGFLKCSLSEN